VTGWGESVAGEGPFYAPETVETAWHILRDFIWPILKDRKFNSASEIWNLLAPIRGHNMAKGAIESAIWDAEAKQIGLPLWKLLGGVREEIPCGVSIGIKGSVEELAATVERELAAGYQRIKIKIKPGKDIEPVEHLRQRFPKIRLMVDANSAYQLEDWPHLKRLEAYYLMMIEQPLAGTISTATRNYNANSIPQFALMSAFTPTSMPVRPSNWAPAGSLTSSSAV